VLVMRGPGEVLKSTAERLTSTKGVKYGKLNLATTGQDLP
jgi:CopG family nickel-responsive transcriptional regulator